MVTYHGGFTVVGWGHGGSYMEVSWWFGRGEGGTAKALRGLCGAWEVFTRWFGGGVLLGDECWEVLGRHG